MPATPDRSASLDALARRAWAPGAAEPGAESALYDELRARFLPLAKRRVRTDDAEDVVQEALRIVHLRGRLRQRDEGLLPWSLAILRNVIGNYYQKRKRRDREEAFGAEAVARDGRPGADDALEVGQRLDRLAEGIARLAQKDPRCGAIFARIVAVVTEEGSSGARVSSRLVDALGGEISRDTLYVLLHRCRARLREILTRIEEENEHP
jgi:DNA-directed RNA polymerase specialized sigma24 family protein